MLKLFRASRSNILVWFLMGLLIIGLAGFGIGVSGALSGRDVARVGDQSVDVDTFARTMSQELNALTTQTGRNISVAEARQFGVDRMVLARLVNEAAIDGEAARLGLSVGDETVREQVMSASAFQGIDGSFDRTAYVFALQRLGVTVSAFEEMLRREAARALVTTAVQSATAMPDSLALNLLDYHGEARGFDWIRLDAALLPEPVPAPTEADLAAWHEANASRYTRPETQLITYAAALPEAIAASIEVAEEDLRAAYDAAGTRFQTPERRILDRIGFGSDADAEAARARLDAGEIDFDALATERGFTAAEIDQGPVVASSLPPAAREAVFGHDGPGIVGPVPTSLGPSLFRINAVLDERIVPFEEARETLASERALEAARLEISEATHSIDDLIAGGATLEEIAQETLMELGTIALNAESQDGLAAEPAFRELAADALPGQETDLAELTDGGLVALRVDEVEPAAVIPLAEIRDRVAADWTEARTAEALTALAEGYREEIDGGVSLADLATRLGQVPTTAAPVARGGAAPNLPATLMTDIFAAEQGDVIIQADGADVILAQLNVIEPFDPDQPENAAVLESLRGQYREQVAGDTLALFVAALRNQAGVTVNESLIDTTLSQFQ